MCTTDCLDPGTAFIVFVGMMMMMIDDDDDDYADDDDNDDDRVGLNPTPKR